MNALPALLIEHAVTNNTAYGQPCPPADSPDRAEALSSWHLVRTAGDKAFWRRISIRGSSYRRRRRRREERETRRGDAGDGHAKIYRLGFFEAGRREGWADSATHRWNRRGPIR